MKNEFLIGRRNTGEAVTASLDGGIQALIAGCSGSGKSAFVRNFLLNAFSAYGSNLQVVIIDPKAVSFSGFERRAHLYTDPNEYVQLVDALVSEMERRYARMQNGGMVELPLTEKTPFILLVVDEFAAFSGCQSLTKAQREALMANLTAYSNQCRQANMGAVYITQTPDVSVIPAAIRNNCSTRIALRLLSASAVDMISGDRFEECRADMIRLPGQFYAMTATTHGLFVRARAPFLDDAAIAEKLGTMAQDRRGLYCLNWDDPEYLG